MRYLFAIMVGTLPTHAFAAQVCEDVPDAIAYSERSTNFDGSVYFGNPKVYVHGGYVALAHLSRNETEIGFCAIVQKKFVARGEQTSDSPETVTLNAAGTFSDLFNADSYYSTPWVVCR